MPDYEFICDECHDYVVIEHPMKDPHPTNHRGCGGLLKRYYRPTPVIYVHSGFFKTDQILSKSEVE
jgi:predicted nucleic acid-binding Zn ribbon protein